MSTCDRCLRNCGWRTIVEEAVELQLEKNVSSISHMSIKWSVKPPINWQRDSGTGNNQQTLSIYENVLQQKTVYNISVQGEWLFRIRHLVLKYVIYCSVRAPACVRACV